jgi:hypothetical protein
VHSPHRSVLPLLPAAPGGAVRLRLPGSILPPGEPQQANACAFWRGCTGPLGDEGSVGSRRRIGCGGARGPASAPLPTSRHYPRPHLAFDHMATLSAPISLQSRDISHLLSVSARRELTAAPRPREARRGSPGYLPARPRARSCARSFSKWDGGRALAAATIVSTKASWASLATASKFAS